MEMNKSKGKGSGINRRGFLKAAGSAPFSVTSSGSYNLNADQSQVVTIRYQPTSRGTHTSTVVFTGGSGATVPVIGKTKNQGLPWMQLLLGD